MKRFCIVGILLVCLFVLLLARAEAGPNVVLIMTDDQGYGDFSCHGNPVLRTPHMDRLAAESIRLTDFHVAPVCTPTRGQLLTGVDALRNGATDATGQRFLLKRGIPTMGDVFLAGGYRTALYGKWHLGGNFVDFRPHERGFEDAVHYLRGGVQSHPNYWNNDLFDDVLYHNGKLEQYPGYATDVWFDLGTAFVQKCKREGQPFFLYLPLNAPHGPLLAPDRYREPYKDVVDKETATFFAMIASVDERLATFLDMLEAEGLREDTILIFLTDNGTAGGADVHNAGLRGKKGSLYEGGHRVPCWISWPAGDLREPGDVDALTQCQDLLPTLIELCGLQAPEGAQFDGTSLAPLLRGQSQPELDERILVVQRRTRKGPAAVMLQKWRLVENELLDLRLDPGQTTDVAAAHPEIVRRLRQHYEQWWASVEPHLGLEAYRIGADDEEMMLTAYDWEFGRTVPNWGHIRRGEKGNGRYTVVIDRPGRYRVALRRWPKESGVDICKGVPRYIPADPYLAYEDNSRDPNVPPFPPGKALDIVRARIRIGDQEQSQPVQADDKQVTFTFELAAGPSELQTWFATRDGAEFGAYYVYIQGTGNRE